MRAVPEMKESLEPVEADLGALPRDELQRMVAAGAEVAEISGILRKTGDNVVGEILRGQGTFYEWDHYPAGDVYDHETHAQYYYHAHPQDQRFESEHGHFHTFLRAKGMPKDIRPAPVAGKAQDLADSLSHLIAISMDPAGEPLRLFTVNRWVTGEVWYRGEDVCALLERFRIGHAQPSWPANRWITAMLVLFAPQIRELVRIRDRSLAAWQAKHPDRDAFEDRDLEVTSYLDISVEQQRRDVAAALGD